MYFDFGLKSVLLLIFFFHGAVFSTLLFIKSIRGKHQSSFWLGLFTLLCVCYITPFMLGYAGWYSIESYRNILFYVPFQQLLFLPPVLYFYFHALLDRTFIFSKKDYIHFLPAICYLIYSISIFVIDQVVLHDYYFYADGKDKDFAFWYQVIGFISLAFYLIRSLNLYKKYKNITFNTTSFADSLMFEWAKRFLLAFLLLLAIRVLFFLINPEWAAFGRKFWYYLCFSVLFYYISISGYINSIRSVTSLAETNPTDNLKFTSNSMTEADLLTPNFNHGKEEIPDLALWKEKIELLMRQEKLYENSELMLSDLCEKLEIHTKKGSQLINQGFEMNFNDFVNHYRTLAVIEKIDEGEHTVYTLLSLAFESGFNSKSTFNRAFKRHTQLTPKAYIGKTHPKMSAKS